MMENKGNWYLDFVILVISQKIGDAPTVLISTVNCSAWRADSGTLENPCPIYPVLVVEPAHREYPDLGLYMEEVQSRPKPLSLEFVYHFIGDIANGLHALHMYGIIHGDLKPRNILLFETTRECCLAAKICDFGSIGVDISEDHRPRGWTKDWLPPEFDPFEDAKKTWDVYSFGLICRYLATDGLNTDLPENQSVWREIIEHHHLESSRRQGLLLQPLFDLLESSLKHSEDQRMQYIESGIRERLFRRNGTGTLQSLTVDRCSILHYSIGPENLSYRFEQV
jgi:serine/threonine protein kinase